jgi:ribosomal-protein-alanine N-acetyltransferase
MMKALMSTTDSDRSDRSQIKIEPAGWRDVMVVHRLSQICFGRYAWPWIDVLDALSSRRSVRLKAVRDDEIVGYVIGDQRSAEEGWIASIAVHPDYRRRGLGNRLMELAETKLERPVIRLTLRQSNAAALALYRERGYREIGVWPDYYHGKEDALVMEKWTNEGHDL